MKFIPLTLFFLLSIASNGQFIQNGDMEEFKDDFFFNCFSKYWETVNGASHFVTTCNGNYINLQQLLINSNDESVAYITNNHSHRNGETIGQVLKSKLIKNHQYQISFSVTYLNNNQYSGPIVNKRKPLLVTSFNEKKPTNFLEINGIYNDTLTLTQEKKWIKHSFCFIVEDSDIEYISFSNYNITSNRYADILIDNVDIVESPLSFNASNDTTLCKGDTITLNIGNNKAIDYLWLGLPIVPTRDSIINITRTGTYFSGIGFPCSSLWDTIKVEAPNKLSFSFDEKFDSLFCIGELVQLEVDIPNVKYLWQDSSTNSKFNVKQNGTYWVQISDQCDSMVSDTVNIRFKDPLLFDVGFDTILCRNDSLDIDMPDTSLIYQWQDGSNQTKYKIFNEGIYWVKAENNCESVRDTFLIHKPLKPIIDTLLFLEKYYLQTNITNAEKYQWIFCDSMQIEDENNSILSVNKTGNYSLVVDQFGCLDTSNCILVEIKEERTYKFNIYPNPTLSSLYIENSTPFESMNIIVRNILGQVNESKIFTNNNSQNILNIHGKPGPYIIEIKVDQEKPEFYKIIKQ